jgi:hypothetical protein
MGILDLGMKIGNTGGKREGRPGFLHPDALRAALGRDPKQPEPPKEREAPHEHQPQGR